ncbi:dTDP-glucose 4,6-dehydratase [Streptomyces glaucescens]|uniref:dTDP-glucose 4,6-dehydratase n=1 Tax=Streptomyces glaucescens TaxID=1907 RepID=B0B0U9_STRGA|nr:dTDP-glucose 4,6-dehydratase [Streptomyces glaucescens]AIR96223.1 dTDP-glucose 4,6-dehydratase [Streptomyces glaucescens]CAL64861.1 dTDP-glucose 4,6-dehydratase GacB [Streptomyces glaucescens]
MTTTILVTGGAGFIGSAYVRRLLSPGAPGGVAVTVLDKLTYAGSLARLHAVRDHPGLTFVQGDVCDTALVDTLAARHDDIVHFAAESHVDRSITDSGAFTRTNVLGTQVLLDAALRHGVRTFVHVSTDEVYGSLPHGAAAESDPLLPTSPYAASKAASDLMALAHHRTHGLDVRVTRCSNNFGPHQHPEKLIPRFLTSLLSGGTVPLYGDGRHVRDWLHVDDHVRAVELVRVSGRPGEIYNIGGGTSLPNLELTHRLLALCGAGPERIVHVENRKGHDRRYAVDHSKITAELGYRPRTDFATALADTAKWYERHEDWWRPLLAAT